jgi:hypothetical protein
MHRLIGYKILLRGFHPWYKDLIKVTPDISAPTLHLLFPAIKKSSLILFFCIALLHQVSFSQTGARQDISLNDNWQTIATNENKLLPPNSYEIALDKNWKTVNIPHNWDTYEGYRRLLHGNRHGDAWYRKTFTTSQSKTSKRFFLFFEGVGSYATVFLNGKKVGEHAGGRTTFTIDITEQVKTDGSRNHLAVRAYHPSNIRDLPWVCGGCSDERGFSEGSQPMGIFRPVHLIVTNEVRIEPFGIHAWNDSTVSENSAHINLNSTLKNYSSRPKSVTVINQLQDATGSTISKAINQIIVQPKESASLQQLLSASGNVHLWSLQNPYLYKIRTSILCDGKIIDEILTPYGIRWIKWTHTMPNSSNQFLLNGKPVFINGIAEYEHLLGNSHSFSNGQIRSRVKIIKAAGFNAFRDAHQPHNLLYQYLWDSTGILSWTQLSAHVWYDTKAFRDQFKTLLKEWVIERRNSPSIVLWGLQNESKLPREFAEECVALVRSLDPTASSQRLVTACNGGEGTDWDVPQNWTGTYGGDPATYATDLKKQILVGEYGAWRTLDLHNEKNADQNGMYSEDRMTALMETKVKLAESAKDSAAGHFAWLLTSHDNPGRVQGGEGYRELDRVGPVNYKGLLTPWEEPLDVFYMYRSNYASKETAPMVYIVSHTWPGRWTVPGIKDNLIVYSNCDEVELFNDMNAVSLGKRKRNGIGTHFQWDSVNILYNVLYAVGYVNGKAVSKDTIVLQHLPQSPNFNKLFAGATSITKPQPDYNYICRINCGGPAYKDENGNTWSGDRATPNSQPTTPNSQLTSHNSQLTTHHSQITTYGSSSWTNDFPEIPAFFASQRRTYSPIQGTKDWPLFQTFRYGRDKLNYTLPVQDGAYLVELYFAEPWWGVGGGIDCSGFRLFDVAINDKVVIKNLDIWREAGTNRALKKTVRVHVTGGQLKISFPNVQVGQAILSAIAVATLDQKIRPVPSREPLIKTVVPATPIKYEVESWLDIGVKQFSDGSKTIFSLPPTLFGADWIRFPENTSGSLQFNLTDEADVYIAVIEKGSRFPALSGFEETNSFIRNSATKNNIFSVYKKRFAKNAPVSIAMDSIKGIFVVPASGMQPAFDLKPAVSHRPATAIKTGEGFVTKQVNERETIIFGKNETSMYWNINIGAADIYSISIRYSNTSDKNLSGRIEIAMADGKIIKNEKILFTPSKSGKWSYITTNTGTMINAGNYSIKIIAENAIGVGISGLDVQ